MWVVGRRFYCRRFRFCDVSIDEQKIYDFPPRMTIFNTCIPILMLFSYFSPFSFYYCATKVTLSAKKKNKRLANEKKRYVITSDFRFCNNKSWDTASKPTTSLRNISSHLLTSEFTMLKALTQRVHPIQWG